MHDTIIAADIIEEAKKRKNVRGVVIEVGELASLTAGELRATLTTMVPWKVKVVTKRAEVACACGYRGKPEIIERAHDICLFCCPSCKKTPQVIVGSDIVLVKVDADDA